MYLFAGTGSGANAIHIANDFIYGIGASKGKPLISGLSIESLVSNQAILTCLGNDIGYDNIFSFQLDVKAKENDLLIVLSGSGNSKNIINVVKTAKNKKVKTFGIVAFDGGKCKEMIDDYIFIQKNNMEMLKMLK